MAINLMKKPSPIPAAKVASVTVNKKPAANFSPKPAPIIKKVAKPVPVEVEEEVEENDDEAVDEQPEEEVEEEAEEEVEEEAPPPKKLVKPAHGLAKTLSTQTKPVQSTAKPPPQGKPLAKGQGLSFIKKGSEAKKAMEKEEVKAEQKAKGNIRRFWMPPNGSSRITFLDGDMKDGMLDIPFFYQHSVFMNGSYNNHFICTNDEEPCPICEGGDNSTYVGCLTIINHDEYTSKKDGKTYKDQIQLYVAKRQTIKQLMKAAAKRGGLSGWTVDVSRSGDKSSAVGDGFDFEEHRTLVQLQKLYGAKDKVIKPYDYNETLAGIYVTAKDLRKMGFGASTGPVGSESEPDEEYEESL